MSKEKKVRSPQEKAKHDLMVAEIVYYSIGGIVMVLGIVFSIFGLILINPSKGNFQNSALLAAQTNFFKWLKWDTTFANFGLILMTAAILYFMIAFAIFAKKGDEVEKKSNVKKSRQRQVVFTAPVVEQVPPTNESEAEEVPEDNQ